MKSLQLEIPDLLAQEVEVLVGKGWFAHASELKRIALVEFFRRHCFESVDRAIPMRRHLLVPVLSLFRSDQVVCIFRKHPISATEQSSSRMKEGFLHVPGRHTLRTHPPQ